MLRRIGLVLAALFIALQFIPRNFTNPPVIQEPAWDSPETRELAVRACFDCHSNETKYQWFHYIQPASLLVQRDIEGGRSHMNFSEWNVEWEDAENAAEVIADGEMPLLQYLVAHPEAWLTTTEKESLMRGYNATFGAELDGALEDETEQAEEATEEAQEQAEEQLEEQQEASEEATEEAQP